MEIQNGEKTVMKPRLGRRVLLFPAPFQGHINPMLQLASILHSQGFSITILHTHFNSPNPSNYPHFTFLAMPDDVAEARVSPSASTHDLLARMIFLNENCGDLLSELLAKLMAENGNEGRVVCLISDALWYFTQRVADSVGLPRMVLRTSSLAAFRIFAGLPDLWEKGYFQISKEDSSVAESPVPVFPVLKIKDIAKIVAPSSSDAPKQFVVNMVSQAKLSSGLIWNSFKELEESDLPTMLQDFPVPNFLIGPFYKYFPATASSLLDQDWSSLSWLDSQAPNSVLYVSFGSIAAIDETDFLEVAWGLANSKQPFLWVIRPGLVSGSEWLETLPNGFLDSLEGRGYIVKWAPQQEVLAHPATGGFWTHCGWNSTLESICEGVPMICSPIFGDQVIDARYVADVWKVGMHLENGMKREEIETAIQRLMVDEEGEEMRNTILRLKEKVNLSLKQGGPSFQYLENLLDYIKSF